MQTTISDSQFNTLQVARKIKDVMNEVSALHDIINQLGIPDWIVEDDNTKDVDGYVCDAENALSDAINSLCGVFSTEMFNSIIENNKSS